MKKISLIITLLIIACMTCGQSFAQSKKKGKSTKKAKTEKVFVTKANTTRITVFIRSKKYNDESFLIDFRTNGTNVIVGYPKDKSKCTTYSYSERFLKACGIINNSKISIKSKAKGMKAIAGDLIQITCYHGKQSIFTLEKYKQVQNCDGNLDTVVNELIELAYGRVVEDDNQDGQKKDNKSKNKDCKEKKTPDIIPYEKDKD